MTGASNCGWGHGSPGRCPRSAQLPRGAAWTLAGAEENARAWHVKRLFELQQKGLSSKLRGWSDDWGGLCWTPSTIPHQAVTGRPLSLDGDSPRAPPFPKCLVVSRGTNLDAWCHRGKRHGHVCQREEERRGRWTPAHVRPRILPRRLIPVPSTVGVALVSGAHNGAQEGRKQPKSRPAPGTSPAKVPSAVLTWPPR